MHGAVLLRPTAANIARGCAHLSCEYILRGQSALLRTSPRVRATATAVALALTAVLSPRVAATADLPPQSLDDTLIRNLGLGQTEASNDNHDCRGSIVAGAFDNDEDYTAALVHQKRIGLLGAELAAICDHSENVGSASSLSAPMGGTQATKTATQFNFARRRIEARLRRRSSRDFDGVRYADLGSQNDGSASASEDPDLGWAVFGSTQWDRRDGTRTHFESGYEANVFSGVVGADYAWSRTVAGLWVGYSDAEADTHAGGVTSTDVFLSAGDLQKVCGNIPGEGTASDRGPEVGAYFGARVGAHGFVDATASFADRDSYDRNTCAIEFKSGEANPSVTMDGKLFSDANDSGGLDAGDIVADDIFAGRIKGDTSIREYEVTLRAGVNVPLWGMIVSPQGAVDYRRSVIDGFTESGRSTISNTVYSAHLPTDVNPHARTVDSDLCDAAYVPPPGVLTADPEDRCMANFSSSTPSGLEITYDDQERGSLRLALGAQVALPIETSFGAIVPHVGAAWRHEFDDDRDSVTFQMAGDHRANPTRLTFSTEEPDADDAVFSAGIAVQVGEGVTANVEVSHVAFNELVESTAVTVQARWRF